MDYISKLLLTQKGGLKNRQRVSMPFRLLRKQQGIRDFVAFPCTLSYEQMSQMLEENQKLSQSASKFENL